MQSEPQFPGGNPRDSRTGNPVDRPPGIVRQQACEITHSSSTFYDKKNAYSHMGIFLKVNKGVFPIYFF